MVRFQVALNELWSFLFVLVRTAGILSVIPIIGSGMVPLRVKAGIAFAVAMVFAPIVTVQFRPDWLQPMHLTMGLAMELMIGLVLGFATRLLISAVEFAGSMIGIQLGLSVAVQLDPVNQVEVPVLGSFLAILMSLLYFVVDGHHLLLFALGASFSLIPPFGAHVSRAILSDQVIVLHDMFVLALKLALPVMASTFFVYVVLGILGRVMPQMNVLFTGFPLTIGLGLLVLGFSLPLFSLLFQQSIIGLEEVMISLMKEMGRG